ncbi:TniQ family protein [Streptomyces sp. NPDC048279]|uniref:TniQ family protein n=1 Tax=Streptomyces sp. NPDC048279 TaxID=3154714 RepID=UPI0034417A57
MPARFAPVAQELTGSWIRRMTAGFGLSAQDLLRAVLDGPHGVHVTGTPKTGLELFLNAPAQAALAQFTGTPLSRLTAMLPSLAVCHSRLEDAPLRRAAWYTPGTAWVAACPPCTGRAWLAGPGVLVYPGAAGHICRRHRRWLLARAGKPAGIALQSLPEILAAHQRHVALVRTHPRGGDVVAFAAGVVWSWQVQRWRSETVWQDRVRRLAAVTGCPPAVIVPHALLAYPETIAVARLLGDGRWQQRLRLSVTTAGAAAAERLFLQEVGLRIGRPWLADWLGACSRARGWEAARADPLRQWLLTVADGTSDDRLWMVDQSVARPAEYSDRAALLGDGRTRALSEQARAAFLTSGWEPLPPRQPGRAPYL